LEDSNFNVKITLQDFVNTCLPVRLLYVNAAENPNEAVNGIRRDREAQARYEKD
jgi:hypothetical protein